MIFRMISEMCAILMQSIFQNSCTEWALSTIIGLGFLFSFLFLFCSRLVLNLWCGWRCFGFTNFLTRPMRWGWLWYRQPVVWYKRKYWWHWHLLSLHMEGNMWKSRCCSYKWKKDSGILVTCMRSSTILKCAFFALLPYSSGGTIYSVLCRMIRMSVSDLLR